MSMILLWIFVVWGWMDIERAYLAFKAQAASRFESLRQASLRRDREVRVAMESYRRFVAEHDIDTASTDALLRRLLARPARMVVLSEPLDGPWNAPVNGPANGSSGGPHAASPRFPFIAVNGCQCADCRAQLCAWMRVAIDAYERAGSQEGT